MAEGGSGIGGSENPGVSRTLLGLGGLGALLIVIAIAAWASRSGPAEQAGLIPTGVPVATLGGLTLAAPEFRIAERRLALTLDFPRQDFEGSWYALERDARIWITYGVRREGALVVQVAPIRMPERSPVQRLVITGWFDRNAPPPATGEAIALTFEVDGALFKKAGPLQIKLDGLEGVAK